MLLIYSLFLNLMSATQDYKTEKTVFSFVYCNRDSRSFIRYLDINRQGGKNTGSFSLCPLHLSWCNVCRPNTARLLECLCANWLLLRFTLYFSRLFSYFVTPMQMKRKWWQQLKYLWVFFFCCLFKGINQQERLLWTKRKSTINNCFVIFPSIWSENKQAVLVAAEAWTTNLLKSIQSYSLSSTFVYIRHSLQNYWHHFGRSAISIKMN